MDESGSFGSPPDRSFPAPLHAQISDDIRSRISSGDWAPHYRLKPEPDLAAELGVSRGTLRRALTTLINEGMLVQIRGRGTFVTSTVLEPAIAQKLSTLSEDFAAQNISWRTEVIETSLIEAPRPVSSLLDVRAGERILRLVRRGVTDKGPVAHLINFVRTDLAPGIEEIDFNTVSLFGVLEHRYGLTIGSGRRTFTAVLAPAEVVESLSLSESTPVQHLEQVTYLEDGRPVEYSDVWLDSAKIRVTSVVGRT
ncbi:GntR family transcriptional regulator [Lysinibacter sp. HNR]|uniref:GntR family transcriptional regulator n=1 Tax=Lysinibacter sp. HNR TaxID=3031408 RepID=UPI002435BD88|nr:GntR family transcriptional regulator [Lysinibacter sp. HNR]WGD37762.1 GntR family transcriptional regulator [Lysinibacter sp. HNR]